MSDATTTVAPGTSSGTTQQNAGKSSEVQQAALEGKGAQQGGQQGTQQSQRDYQAEISKLMQESGFKMKLGGREQQVSFQDLVRKAQLGYGSEKAVEEVRTAKQEAESVKQWKAAMEAEDPGAAEQAFEALSPRAQMNALQWLQKKAQAFEQERALPPEVLSERRKAMALEQKVREYEQNEKKRAQAETQQKAQAELKQTQQFVLGIAQKALQGLGATENVAPSLIPLVARHLRIASEAAHAVGADISPEMLHEEVISNVRQDLMDQYSMVSNSIQDDSALYDLLGAKTIQRLAKESIRRRNGGTSKKPAPASAKPRTQEKSATDLKKGENPREMNRRIFGSGLL